MSEFIGFRCPSDYSKFLAVLAKVMNKSKQKTAIYLMQLGIEMITNTPDLRDYNLEKMHREIKMFQKYYKQKPITGLTIDDGIRANMFDIMKSHPCRKLIIYGDEVRIDESL